VDESQEVIAASRRPRPPPIDAGGDFPQSRADAAFPRNKDAIAGRLARQAITVSA
jgi:hypothetical protein